MFGNNKLNGEAQLAERSRALVTRPLGTYVLDTRLVDRACSRWTGRVLEAGVLGYCYALLVSVFPRSRLPHPT